MTSGSDSGTIRIWNVESGQCIKLLEGHKKSVIGIEKLTDEQIIISQNDGTINELALWSLRSLAAVFIGYLIYAFIKLKEDNEDDGDKQYDDDGDDDAHVEDDDEDND